MAVNALKNERAFVQKFRQEHPEYYIYGMVYASGGGDKQFRGPGILISDGSQATLLFPDGKSGLDRVCFRKVPTNGLAAKLNETENKPKSRPLFPTDSDGFITCGRNKWFSFPFDPNSQDVAALLNEAVRQHKEAHPKCPPEDLHIYQKEGGKWQKKIDMENELQRQREIINE